MDPSDPYLRRTLKPGFCLLRKSFTWMSRSTSDSTKQSVSNDLCSSESDLESGSSWLNRRFVSVYIDWNPKLDRIDRRNNLWDKMVSKELFNKKPSSSLLNDTEWLSCLPLTWFGEIISQSAINSAEIGSSRPPISKITVTLCYVTSLAHLAARILILSGISR